MNTTSPSMKEFDNTAMVLAVDIADQKSNFKVACVAVEDASEVKLNIKYNFNLISHLKVRDS